MHSDDSLSHSRASNYSAAAKPTKPSGSRENEDVLGHKQSLPYRSFEILDILAIPQQMIV